MKLLLSHVASLAFLAGAAQAQGGVRAARRLQIQSNATASLDFHVYNATLSIADAELEYDQNQNTAAGIAPTISADGATLTSVGNRWSAYALPSPVEIYEDTVLQFAFTLDEETVSGFQALCLDADTELTGANGQCFALATTQGWVDGMLNAATLTGVGQTTQQSIPIGKFFTGTVNYLAIIQDSDGDAVAKSKGSSSVSDLTLVRQGADTLQIEIDGQVEYLENNQMSYSSKAYFQDTADWLMSISEDGASIQINGNQWKALPLPSPYTVTHNTVVEFDAVVSEGGDFHSICLDSNLDAASGENPCVSFMNPRDDAFHMLTTELVVGNSRKLVIPFGQIQGLLANETKEVQYLAFVQDNDVDDKRGGRSTLSHIRIYEEDRMPIEMSIFGENVTVPNIQDSFTWSNSGTYVQDSIDHVMSVSADGTTVTVLGNNFKRFKLPEPIEVKPSTMFKFFLSVPYEMENQFVCLLGDTNNAIDGRNDCYSVSGLDVTSSNTGSKMIQPQTKEGESNSYDLAVGTYFTGPVHYIAWGQDNDKKYTTSRADGESIWSNFVIYDLPSINIGMSSGSVQRSSAVSFTIENDQRSYHSNQDTTPVRDHLATISMDGSSITAKGNMWRAFPLSPPKTAEELGDFVVSFDYLLTDPGDFHVLCFEDNLKWGDHDDPIDNEYDPLRCVEMNQIEGVTTPTMGLYEPRIGEPYRYVTRLGGKFDRFSEWKYLVLVSDNDQGDKTGGEMTVSNIEIFTDVTSCLDETGYNFTLSDCTIDNFLDAVKSKMMETCGVNVVQDPVLELLAHFGVDTEREVYKQIEHICASSYEDSMYDFAKTISSESQLVQEFIDGGSLLNYESDAEGGNLASDGAGIHAADQKASSRVMAWPEHHALDRCDVGAAMCCWVDSRGASALVDNSDVCYVDMKASKRTAHVADGYSIYGDGHAGAVNCHGFAWGTDKGGVADALKGNALFKVGFVEGLYGGLQGNVEQLPGAPMCGCIDRMPVVTNAACTKATDATSTVNVVYDATVKAFSAEYTLGTIEYSDCGDLNAYYKEVVGEDTLDADFIDTRLVGDGGCNLAIGDFLSGKGLAVA